MDFESQLQRAERSNLNVQQRVFHPTLFFHYIRLKWRRSFFQEHVMMKRMSMFGIQGLGAVLFLLLAWPLIAQEAGGFTDDIDAAIKLSKQEGRDLFLFFTGSDWCPPCRKLDGEVFSQAEFLDTAKKNFILVIIDFPKHTPLPEEQQVRNETWANRYGVKQFPTVVVADVELRPIGFMGYSEGGPGPFLKSLVELRNKRLRRDEAFARAAGAENDEDRARFLDQGLSEIELDIVNLYYTEQREVIAKIDADNRLKLREKYFAEQDAEMRKIILADVMAISQLDRPERAIAFIDEVIAEVKLPNEQKFEILQIKLQLLQKSKQFAAAEALMEELLQMPGITNDTRERLLVKKFMQLIAADQSETALSQISQLLNEPGEHLLLKLTLGHVLANQGKTDQALKVFDEALLRARFRPDVMIELVGAKADLLVKQSRDEEALRILDNFADDAQMPTDLRCEALLHQALIMRAAGRTRPAMLTENRAVELADSPSLKREMQKIVERMRAN
jgi:thiol-disulfide isomerase/thioredoxin